MPRPTQVLAFYLLITLLPILFINIDEELKNCIAICPFIINFVVLNLLNKQDAKY